MSNSDPKNNLYSALKYVYVCLFTKIPVIHNYKENINDGRWKSLFYKVADDIA